MKSDMASGPMGEKMKRAVFLAAVGLLLLLALGFKGSLVEVPDLAAPRAGEFDTGRAMARLGRVLADGQPHPVDSAPNDFVRDRLTAELRTLGLTPTVTDDFVCNGSDRSRAVSCARVRNVVATIGPPQGKHLILASHYDSTLVGPGAADDGIGMAVMLETAAQLRGARLAQPVTFLFTDGEEAGLLGARAFLERNPLAGRTGTLLNFEARGVTGPAIMFETNTPDGRAMALYKASVARPAANSLTVDFAKLIPNSTDVEVFKERKGVAILNFAVIGNETRYHTAGDNPAALDRRSVQHMGDQALALARHISSGQPASAEGEHVYADLLGRGLVLMPRWAGLAALALLGGMFVALAWRRRGGVARGAGTLLLAMADAALTIFILQWLVGVVRGGEWWRAHPEAISLAVDVTALASAAVALLWLARPIPRERLRVAYWLLFLILGAALSAIAPGAAIFFLLPPAVALAGIASGRAERAAALVAWALLFLTWAPLLHLSQTLLDFDAAWTFAPIALLILAPLVIELKPLLEEVGRGRATAALAGAAALAWGATFLFPAYSEDRKQAFGIEYVLEGGGARWMLVNDGAPLPNGFDGFAPPAEVPWSARRRWAAPAPAPRGRAPLPMQKLGERPHPEGRLVTLRVTARNPEIVSLRAEPEAQLKAVRIGGATRRFGGGGGKDDFAFRCSGRSCEGATVELLVGSRAPFEATLVSIRGGLPPMAKPLLAARPRTAQAQYSPDATVIVSKARL
jgi:hypothetical protein